MAEGTALDEAVATIQIGGQLLDRDSMQILTRLSSAGERRGRLDGIRLFQSSLGGLLKEMAHWAKVQSDVGILPEEEVVQLIRPFTEMAEVYAASREASADVN